MYKDRFTTWGTNEKDEKILIGLQLDTANFKVVLYTFDGREISKEFADKFINEWGVGKDIELPENTTTKDLEISDDALLPENIKVEGKTGAIRQLQNEWSYQLLTTKLWESFNIELDEIKGKARELKEYSHELFDQCKAYWERALEYRKEKDLSQERLGQIKEEINNVFDHLKHLRQNAVKEKDELTEKFKSQIDEALNKINAALQNNNVHFKTLIEDLKAIQTQLKDADLRRDVKNLLFDEVQKYFEIVKTKRNEVLGSGKNKRLDGLKTVMDKIQKSLDIDKKDLDYNLKRMENSNVSKLEMQLREAKLKVIKDRISSKEEKLNDIQNTYSKIEKEFADKSSKKSKTEDNAKVASIETHDENSITAEEEKLIVEAEKMLQDNGKENENS